MAVPSTRSAPPGAAHQYSLREQNLALVANAVVRSPVPLSRAEVSSATGLARATVSTLVDRLVLGGVLRELPPVSSGGAGRPKVPLVAAPRTYVALGMELSASHVGGVVADLTGDVVDKIVEVGDYRDQDPAVLLGHLGAIARTLISRNQNQGMRFAGATLAMPGLVDSVTGFVQVAPNLGWSSIYPAEYLGLADFPVLVANDARVAALAELEVAAEESFIFITADVGIGSAVVLNGEILSGQHGWAGELGHVVVDPNGPKCRCGSHGCAERYAGKVAVMIGAGLSPDSDINDVVRLLEAGDEKAARSVRRGAWALGAALADAVNILDISTVVIGGELAVLTSWAAEEVAHQIRGRVLSGPYVPVTLREAQTGPHPAMTGGAWAVLEEVFADPSKWV